MKEYVGKFNSKTTKGEISIEVYSTLKKKSNVEYEIVPIYKIGDKEIDFESRSKTFSNHKKAIDYIKNGKEIDFKLDMSWAKGFRELGIMGSGKRLLTNKIEDIQYFNAFFIYQIYKKSKKLEEFSFELFEEPKEVKEKVKPATEVPKLDLTVGKYNLIKLIMEKEMEKEDIEKLEKEVLSL